MVIEYATPEDLENAKNPPIVQAQPAVLPEVKPVKEKENEVSLKNVIYLTLHI